MDADTYFAQNSLPAGTAIVVMIAIVMVRFAVYEWRRRRAAKRLAARNAYLAAIRSAAPRPASRIKAKRTLPSRYAH